ncbi:CaiB/BaiF CoA-transferase family protein [Reyranella sp.]|uniref:CaiB/BaiF CoA transferase family protein n=1 Tax=Reyranella sp. TaxID=1929291 RepID=UPI0011F74943|nr:CoA transferase [Reyranella sp.]TAJ82094.1 MAG: CoA transferase [Reyranella sp.]
MSLPYEGLKVLDVSQGAAGPYCAEVLWQQGADIVKVEPPAGDWSRGVGALRDGISSLTIAMNGGKRGLCVDATTAAGRGILIDLAKQADVVVQNFRPGVATRLGLDPLALRQANPGLIYVSISGYGLAGPYSAAPATDSVMQADAGLMFSNRGEGSPRKMGIFLADLNAGLYAAQAVGAALFQRTRSGTGEHIEINLFDTSAAVLVGNYAEHALEPEREARASVALTAPNGTFQAKDGSINVVTMNDQQFARLAEALGHAEWVDRPEFAGMTARVANVGLLNALIGDVLSGLSVDQWSSRLSDADILHAPVRNYSQCMAHPQAQHLGTFERFQQPGLGAISLPGIPARKLRRRQEAAPYLGEHSVAILEEAGFSRQQINQWLRSGAVLQGSAGSTGGSSKV